VKARELSVTVADKRNRRGSGRRERRTYCPDQRAKDVPSNEEGYSERDNLSRDRELFRDVGESG
jgi:hypothetical protein